MSAGPPQWKAEKILANREQQQCVIKLVEPIDEKGEVDNSRQPLVAKVFPNTASGQIRAINEASHLCKVLAAVQRTRLFQVYVNFDLYPQPHILSEYIPGKTLREFIDGKGLKHDIAVRLLQQLLRALKALVADAKLVHRDIKPDNIIVQPDRHPKLRLIDFGLACELPLGEATLGDGYCGTPLYMAPQATDNAVKKYLLVAADIWSVGVVLYEMLRGENPFVRCTGLVALCHAQKHLRLPADLTDNKALRQLLSGLLQYDETKRIKLDDALARSTQLVRELE